MSMFEIPFVLSRNTDGDPVWAYVINDVEIYNPFRSSCGRFDADPLQTYGITAERARALVTANERDGYRWQA